MCGIAGVFDPVHNLGNQMPIFEDMLKTLKYRGPSDTGIRIFDHTALIHARLAVMDPENGKQPMTFGQYSIIYNGELYNSEEIKKQLIEKGILFQTNCDTEVVLKAYMYYGIDCLQLFNGIFAFAVYDELQDELFLARDKIGVKPLFYTFINDTFVFGSEIKNLLAHPLVMPQLDNEGIHQLMLLGPGKISGSGVFQNIFELKPAEFLLLSKKGYQKKCYYQLMDQIHHDDLPTTIDTVKRLVTEGIERQLVSDVPLACFLSGGLDSSIISAIASKTYQKMGKQLTTFSVNYLDNERYFTSNKFQPDSDDEYIQLVSEAIQSNHISITIDSNDLIDALYEAVDAKDLPGMADVDGSLLLFCKKVKEHVDVALSGECADEIFGGYPWYRDPSILFQEGFPWAQNIEYRNDLLLEKWQIDGRKYVLDLVNETQIHSHILPCEDFEKRMKQMVNLNLNWFMQTLLDRKDRMSMYSGLEVRVPFCDIHILEYLYHTPWSYKDLNGREKGLLREAMKDLLPERVLERKKNPFPKTHHPLYLKQLRYELSLLLNNENEPIWKILNQDEVQKLMHQETEKNWYGQLMTTPQTIAYFLQINYWLKKYKVRIVE